MVLGDGGIISQARLAMQMWENASTEEEDSLNKLLEEYENAMEGTGEATNDEDDTGNGNEEEDEETIDTDTSYITYYADVDGDGTVDGIIFADLAIGDDDDTYGYDAIDSSSLKEYTISEDTYTDDNFGEGYVISPKTETTGEDRFYVMALENADSSYHYWYYNAYGSLPSSKYVDTDDNDFGEGQSNTEYWLEAYANETYGSAYSGTYTDLWSLTDIVGTNVGTSDSIWFVPSLGEWYQIYNTLYTKGIGLGDSYYWTSTVYSSSKAHAVYGGAAWGETTDGLDVMSYTEEPYNITFLENIISDVKLIPVDTDYDVSDNDVLGNDHSMYEDTGTTTPESLGTTSTAQTRLTTTF